MKTNPNDRVAPITHEGQNGGLTKREHFAGLAMQGYMGYEFANHQDPTGVAKYAVECADALIAQLNK